MKVSTTALALATIPALIALPSLAQQSSLQVDGLKFMDHVEGGMIEQDVFVEKESGSAVVWRLAADEAEGFMDAPVHATTEPTHHAPFTPAAAGPYPKGQALGFTLGEWLAAEGTGSYTCTNGEATVQADFGNLVPNGVYTMWYAFAGKPHMGCADCPFSTIDFPLGASDGSQSPFTADAEGDATFEATFEPCLQLGNARLVAMLAIAYHSDGNTYGLSPGDFGTVSHVQLFAPLPDEESWQVGQKQMAGN